MAERQDSSARKLAAVDYAGVVPRVADDEIALPDERRDGRNVCYETAAVDNRVFGPHQRGDLLFERIVQLGRAREYARAMSASAEPFGRPARRGDNLRVPMGYDPVEGS